MEGAISTDLYFVTFLSRQQIIQVWSINYESYFGHFEIFGQCLNIAGYVALS